MILKIKKLGPVDSCTMEIMPFHVVTGKQSSGKSTIAKTLYFFLAIKDDLFGLIYDKNHPLYSNDVEYKKLTSKFKKLIKNRLMDIFGENSGFFRFGSMIKMEYTKDLYIKVTYDEGFSFSFSRSLSLFIKNYEDKYINFLNKNEINKLKKEINDFFCFDYSPLYIPAGRSFITTMGDQFSLFYYKLDDNNKRLIDYLTIKFYESIVLVREVYSKGFASLYYYSNQNNILDDLKPLFKSVIGGDYFYSDGREYLQLEDGEKIDIKSASSGQLESLWIYNILLCYYILDYKKFYIIEEPESNLFPESQKYMMRFIGFIANSGNPVLINTHSPYVLGELNNMIYAGTFKGKKKKLADMIIGSDYQLNFDNVRASFVENGIVSDGMDNEIKQIDNSKLDEISWVINEDYNRLLSIDNGED